MQPCMSTSGMSFWPKQPHRGPSGGKIQGSETQTLLPVTNGAKKAIHVRASTATLDIVRERDCWLLVAHR